MWRHSLKNWEKVDKDSYVFCFEQAEKRLKEVLDDSEKITTRTYALIGLIIPILSVSIGLLIKDVTSQTGFSLLSIVALTVSALLLYSLLLLSELIAVRDNWLSGTEPKNIVQPQFLEREDFIEDEPIKALLLGEIEIIQQKIDENNIVNKKRIITFSCCLKIVIATAITTMVSLLVMMIL